MTASGRIKEAALTVGALLGLLCIVAAVAATLFGITPVVFRSGSMSPTITTGSLAVGRDVPATQVAVGDIIGVDRADGSRITHRVQSIDSVTGNSVSLRLKGDANAQPDESPYVITSATEVVAHVPYLGYFVAWLSTPFAWAAGAILSVVLIWVAFGSRQPRAPSTGGSHRKRGRHERPMAGSVATSIAVVAVVSTVVAVGFAGPQLTAAASTDSAVASAAVTAATLTGPTSFTCTTTGVVTTTASLSWVASNSLYGHRLTYTPPSGAAVVQDIPAGTSTATPPPAVLALLSTMTVTLSSKYFNFISTATLARSISVTTVLNAVKISFCQPGGTSQQAATPRSARIATTETPTTTSPTTTATTTPPTTTPTTTTTSPTTTTTTPPTTTTTTTTTSPTTTTTTPPPTTTTPPPPPPGAFIADGSSRVNGDNTASVTDGRLSITDASGTEVYSRSITPSARYGTGVTWSSDGNLYILRENADPVRIDSTFTAATVPTSALPADVAALL